MKTGLRHPGYQRRRQCRLRAAPASWHPEDIKAALHKLGYTLDSVAALVAAEGEAPPSRSAVSRAIRGGLHSSRIARCVSRLIGAPISQLWPGMYPGLDTEPGA